MKTPLLLVSVPYGVMFLSGVFGWYIEDGMATLAGISMLIGISWAWTVELKK
jgi:hypothetical protein